MIQKKTIMIIKIIEKKFAKRDAKKFWRRNQSRIKSSSIRV